MARDQGGARLPARLVWSHGPPREQLARLYEEAKAAQWDADRDVDWTLDVDPGAPPLLASGAMAIDWDTFCDPLTAALGTGPEAQRAILAQHHGWFVSQLLHAEQGALVAAARVCAAADSAEAKRCAALQVADEARHSEAYRRYLDKVGISYPVCPPLRELLEQAVRHRHADMTYLGAQLLVEGLGLAAAGLAEPVFGNPLLCHIVRLVRRDEARHVAFGVASLEGFYDELSSAERREREDFLLESCALLRHRFRPVEVWEHFGIDVAAAGACFDDSPDVAALASLAFAHILPELHRVGLLTPRVRQGLEAQGLLYFCNGRSPTAADVDVASGPTRRTGGIPHAVCVPGTDSGTGVACVSAAEVGSRVACLSDAGSAGAGDPLLVLRAALGCVEQIEPGPVLLAMSGLTDRARLAGVPRATVRLEVAGPEGKSAWMVDVGDDRMAYRGALPADRGEVAVRMDLSTWSDVVAGRVTMPVALASGRITVAGDIFKARALEAVLG